MRDPVAVQRQLVTASLVSEAGYRTPLEVC